MDFTIGSFSNWARSSCVLVPPFDAGREEFSSFAPPLSSLAQTRTARPSTLFDAARIFSSVSRPSINPAKVLLSGRKQMRNSLPSNSHRAACSKSSATNFCCACNAVLISATCSAVIPMACASVFVSRTAAARFQSVSSPARLPLRLPLPHGKSQSASRRFLVLQLQERDPQTN